MTTSMLHAIHTFSGGLRHGGDEVVAEGLLALMSTKHGRLEISVTDASGDNYIFGLLLDSDGGGIGEDGSIPLRLQCKKI